MEDHPLILKRELIVARLQEVEAEILDAIKRGEIPPKPWEDEG
jgi:hypothetical protein